MTVAPCPALYTNSTPCSGVLHSLCFTFKLGQRLRLLPHTPKVWSLLLGPLVLGSPEAPNSTVARKLGTKLLQRLALTFLEPRLAPWRYTRAGGQQLDVTLGSDPAGGGQHICSKRLGGTGTS